MLESVAEVMDELQMMEGLRVNETRSQLEKVILKITNGLRWIGVVLFLSLLTIAFFATYFPPIDVRLLVPSLILFSTQMIVALLWMILDMIPAVCNVIFYKTSAFRVRQLELSHDFNMANSLKKFDLRLLKVAHEWTNVQITRLSGRMISFFGGADKVAVFSLAGIGWVVWKNLPVDVQSLDYKAYFFCLAFLSGLTIGGLFVNSSIRRLQYQKDLLTIAIAQLED